MNFQILSHNIFTHANITAKPTGLDTLNVYNVIGGSRSEVFTAAAASTSTTWACNYEAAILPDYIYIAKASYLSRQSQADVTVAITGASNSGFSADVETQSVTFNYYDQENLYNYDYEDFFIDLTHTTAKQYWRVVITTASSVVHKYSKLYLGNKWLFSREPAAPLTYSPTGTSTNAKRQARQFTISFEGLTSAELKLFITNVLTNANTKPLAITSLDYPEMINSKSLIMARVTSWGVTPDFIDNNKLTLVCAEEI